MGSVVEAVEGYLARLAVVDADLSASPEAAVALSLAALIDSESGATAASNAAGRLLDALSALRALAPEQKDEVTPLDEIRARRDRKVGKSDAKDRARPGRGGAS